MSGEVEAAMALVLDGARHTEAYRAGHAAGYAEAVADVVAWLDSQRCEESAVAFAASVKRGAHVGAAKKGGG